jgi:hypothetical protein
LSGCIHSAFNAAKPSTWHSAARLWMVQWFYVKMWNCSFIFATCKYCVRRSTTASDWYIVSKSSWIFRATLSKRKIILPSSTLSEIHYIETPDNALSSQKWIFFKSNRTSRPRRQYYCFILGMAWLRYQSGDRLSWRKFFMVSLRPSTQIPE